MPPSLSFVPDSNRFVGPRRLSHREYAGFMDQPLLRELMSSAGTKKKPRRSEIWEASKAPPSRPSEDLTALGEAITRLPPRYWRERMFFHGARDRDLRVATGKFPATFRKDRRTHPIFVLKMLGDLGRKVCPCSSKNWGAGRFIRSGCILEITGKEQDRNSYLVEWFAFNLPSDPAFTEGLVFMGLVPETCLERCD
jgi:hypothetical protein